MSIRNPENEHRPVRYNVSGLAREVLLRTGKRKFMPGTRNAYFVASPWTDPSESYTFNLGSSAYGGPYTLSSHSTLDDTVSIYEFGKHRPIRQYDSDDKVTQNLDPVGLHFRVQGILQMSGATIDSLPEVTPSDETPSRHEWDDIISWHAGRLSVLNLFSLEVMDPKRERIGNLLANVVDTYRSTDGTSTLYSELYQHAQTTSFPPPDKISFVNHLDDVLLDRFPHLLHSDEETSEV